MIIKQSEKLDLILKGLYKFKDTGKYYSLVSICNAMNISLAIDEWNRLAHRLKNDGYVKTIFHHSDCSLQLTTYGIDYCEQDSYTYSGNAIITNVYNINVKNSSNTNIVSHSDNVNVSNINQKAVELLIEIKDLFESGQVINNEIKKIMIERINNLTSKR